MTMILYHRTTADAASLIVAGGFRDNTGTYLIANEYTGVWLSDRPLDENEGAWGDTMLRVTLDLGEADLAFYEWVEEFKGYREWLIPAAMINRSAARVEILTEEDVDAIIDALHTGALSLD